MGRDTSELMLCPSPHHVRRHRMIWKHIRPSFFPPKPCNAFLSVALRDMKSMAGHILHELAGVYSPTPTRASLPVILLWPHKPLWISPWPSLFLPQGLWTYWSLCRTCISSTPLAGRLLLTLNSGHSSNVTSGRPTLTTFSNMVSSHQPFPILAPLLIFSRALTAHWKYLA